MFKPKLIIAVLLLSLILSLFVGCRAQNGNVSNNEGTEPSGNVTEPSGEVTEPSEDVTEPSGEATEPSEDVTDPTETIYPRTIEAIKSHVEPYMTYREVRVMFGKKDEDDTNTTDVQKAIWYLEDGYYVTIRFYPTITETWAEYLTTFPDNISEEVFAEYYSEWFNHMVAYRAVICKATEVGLPEVIEVLFDYGYGPFQQGE